MDRILPARVILLVFSTGMISNGVESKNRNAGNVKDLCSFEPTLCQADHAYQMKNNKSLTSPHPPWALSRRCQAPFPSPSLIAWTAGR